MGNEPLYITQSCPSWYFPCYNYWYVHLLKFLICSLQFVEKAPEDVVRGVREKAAEAEEKIILTKNRLALLTSTVLVTE
jgi:hypothetical protein